jgi:arabinose-5-phosphate isomerase
MTSSPTDLPATDLLTTGRRVIGREAEALALLGQSLDHRFAEAVNMILSVRGRVIVSGMGKSGHIARKIAATFASTGTPAHFVHPAEASHGDLGMVAEGDVVLCLSNSGETPELADLLAHTRRFGIPLIAILSREDSTLGRQAEVALVLPPAPEACGTGIVPTTSTTMMVALGDALAVVLMEHRKFTPDHFRLFHPGGKLGARLLKVADLMHPDAPQVTADVPMSETLLVMSRAGFGAVGVTDAGGYLQGVITDGDLRRHMAGLLELDAGQVMTRNPRTITPVALAEAALAMMNDRKITCLMVVPEGTGRIAGVLHIHDLLRAGLA